VCGSNPALSEDIAPSEDANYEFFHRVEVGDSSVIWF
jgi:hypothetical protein